MQLFAKFKNLSWSDWKRFFWKESNPGQIYAGRAISPLRYPCSPNIKLFVKAKLKLLFESNTHSVFKTRHSPLDMHGPKSSQEFNTELKYVRF